MIVNDRDWVRIMSFLVTQLGGTATVPLVAIEEDNKVFGYHLDIQERAFKLYVEERRK